MVIHDCTIILLSNYYFGNRKGLLDHIQTKKYIWVVTAHVFSPAFLLFDEIFFLKLTRTAWHGFPFRNYSTVVFASSRGYV